MPTPTTLKQIRDRALDSADMTDGFSVEARTNEYINYYLSKIHRAVCDANEDWVVSKHTVTLVSGQEEYDLPSNFYKAIKVFWLDGSSYRYVLDRYEHRKVDGHRPAQTSGSVEVWYAPDYEPLLDDDDTLQWSLPYGWEEYAVLATAARLGVKEETDTMPLKGEAMECFQDIISSVEPRDMGEPGQIEDVYRRWNRSYTYGHEKSQDIRYRLRGSKISLIEFGYQGV